MPRKIEFTAEVRNAGMYDGETKGHVIVTDDATDAEIRAGIGRVVADKAGGGAHYAANICTSEQ